MKKMIATIMLSAVTVGMLLSPVMATQASAAEQIAFYVH